MIFRITDWRFRIRTVVIFRIPNWRFMIRAVMILLLLICGLGF